jgi:hypothetical protein
VRAAVAYVASRLISRAESSFVYDIAGPGHRSMGGLVNEKCVNVYDFSENCQLTGNCSAGLFQLFHYGERIHITLEIRGASFRGFDHGVGRHFSGIVNGPRISFNDQSDNRRHQYWCEPQRYTRLPDREGGETDDGLDSQARESMPANPIVG